MNEIKQATLALALYYFAVHLRACKIFELAGVGVYNYVDEFFLGASDLPSIHTTQRKKNQITGDGKIF